MGCEDSGEEDGAAVGARRYLRQGAPELPALEEWLGADTFDADIHLGNYFGDDPMAGLSLLQQAAVWQYLLGWAANAYFLRTPVTALRWDRYGNRWTFTTRALPKASGQWVQSIVAPLGEWASDTTPERPSFAGYILTSTAPRPVLI